MLNLCSSISLPTTNVLFYHWCHKKQKCRFLIWTDWNLRTIWVVSLLLYAGKKKQCKMKSQNIVTHAKACSDSPTSKSNDNTEHLKLINDRILGRCPVCNQLTLSSSRKEYGLQFWWRHWSMWPLECILSITMFSDAKRIGLLAYFFKWQPSS